MNAEGGLAVATPVREAPDLLDLATLVLRGWPIVLGVVAASLLLMILYLNVATYRYTAELKLTVAQSGTGSLSTSLKNLSGLASIAGVQLPQDSGAIAFLRYGENLRSATAARVIVADPALVRTIFATEWDEERQAFVEPRSSLRTLANGAKRLIGVPVYPWREPDAVRIQAWLHRHVSVVQDQRRPLATVSFRHPDPEFAGRFLMALHQGVDRDLKRRALARADSNIAYLEEKLRTVSVAEHRAALTDALGEQERIRMLAGSGAPFAAEPVGEVTVSDRPTFPRPALFLVGAALVGAFLGSLVVLVRAWLDVKRMRSAAGAPGTA
jgi:hypothetical protein